MKQKIKQVMLLFLFGMISLGANAKVLSGSYESSDSQGTVNWSLDTGTGLLSFTGDGVIGYKSFVCEYEDYQKYYPWIEYRSMVRKVEIGGQITGIGYAAFAFCRNLTSVTIPNTVSDICYKAFYGCI